MGYWGSCTCNGCPDTSKFTVMVNVQSGRVLELEDQKPSKHTFTGTDFCLQSALIRLIVSNSK